IPFQHFVRRRRATPRQGWFLMASENPYQAPDQQITKKPQSPPRKGLWRGAVYAALCWGLVWVIAASEWPYPLQPHYYLCFPLLILKDWGLLETSVHVPVVPDRVVYGSGPMIYLLAGWLIERWTVRRLLFLATSPTTQESDSTENCQERRSWFRHGGERPGMR